ncbi:polyprenol monophosphomannose synthase [Actinoallomurus purpureus]|uniref:polyprenol monophosphomannose synthase n=1 Tax=Actinoallomurus purpureus TaxID=478114 RepID=UPI002093EACD|nr:polyprenol monophosphomannose synthase [Actinoallomurus purpureus]MCO6004216.1 polyprenol monophosphomannose synthase [Actinoallomurus purpureus]
MLNTEDIGRVLVIIPTYNERENIESIVARVRAAVPEADVLVADDNSPDGTGKIADGLADGDERVHVLHRAGKEGLGAAYIAGFNWGMDHGFDVLVEMDADGSHQPEELPRLLSALGEADLVIGSRWIRGGTVENWPLNREIISRGANIYARIMLGIPVRDATGGYRAYRATTLQKIDIDGVASQGYCFQVDLTLRTVRNGLRVTEVPIRFVERTHGASKMSRAIMIEAFLRIARWGFAYWAGRFTGRGRR